MPTAFNFFWATKCCPGVDVYSCFFVKYKNTHAHSFFRCVFLKGGAVKTVIKRNRNTWSIKPLIRATPPHVLSQRPAGITALSTRSRGAVHMDFAELPLERNTINYPPAPPLIYGQPPPPNCCPPPIFVAFVVATWPILSPILHSPTEFLPRLQFLYTMVTRRCRKWRFQLTKYTCALDVSHLDILWTANFLVISAVQVAIHPPQCFLHDFTAVLKTPHFA